MISWIWVDQRPNVGHWLFGNFWEMRLYCGDYCLSGSQKFGWQSRLDFELKWDQKRIVARAGSRTKCG